MRVVSVSSELSLGSPQADILHPLLRAEQIQPSECLQATTPTTKRALEPFWCDFERAIASQEPPDSSAYDILEQQMEERRHEDTLVGYKAAIILQGFAFQRQRSQGIHYSQDEIKSYYHGMEPHLRHASIKLGQLLTGEPLETSKQQAQAALDGYTGILSEVVTIAAFAAGGALALPAPIRQEGSLFKAYNHDLLVHHKGIWRPVSTTHLGKDTRLTPLVMNIRVGKWLKRTLWRAAPEDARQQPPFAELGQNDSHGALSIAKALIAEMQKSTARPEIVTASVHSLGEALVENLEQYPTFIP